MKYKNVKTGAVIETFGKISGGDWQEVITAAVENKAKGGESALAEAVESAHVKAAPKSPAKSQTKSASKSAAPKTKKK